MQGDALRLPVPDATIDGVTCGFALRNLVELPPFFRELARVLRPGGRIALLEAATPPNRLMRWGHGLYFGKAVPLIGRLVSDASAYRYLPRSVAYLPEPDEILPHDGGGIVCLWHEQRVAIVVDPDEAVVPMKSIPTRSPTGASASTASGRLATGSLSPVSADSSTARSSALSSRMSAGTRSPASTMTTSPGTRSAAGMRLVRPARRTWAVGSARAWSAARARSLRASCTITRPIVASAPAKRKAASAWSPRAK